MMGFLRRGLLDQETNLMILLITFKQGMIVYATPGWNVAHGAGVGTGDPDFSA
jgi:hypothetical protein